MVRFLPGARAVSICCNWILVYFGIKVQDGVNLSTVDQMWDDGNNLGPAEIHNLLNRIMYQHRNKFDPLWNSLVLGGVKNGKKYLGVVRFVLSLWTCYCECLKICYNITCAFPNLLGLLASMNFMVYVLT